MSLITREMQIKTTVRSFVLTRMAKIGLTTLNVSDSLEQLAIFASKNVKQYNDFVELFGSF